MNRKNPIEAHEKEILVAAAIAVAGIIGFSMWKSSADASAAKAAAVLAPRTANALDNYRVVISSSTPMPVPTAASITPELQAIPGLSGAAVQQVTQSADGKTVTVLFTAPPNMAVAIQTALTPSSAAVGVTYAVTDLGIAVQ